MRGWLAVGAVVHEPVSGSKFPASSELTANFAEPEAELIAVWKR
jgi:hypothetical protein